MNSHLVNDILTVLQKTLGTEPVALHEPWFDNREWSYLKECLDSTFVSSVGKFVDRFEAKLAEYTGAQYAVATVNGTAAIHTALMLAGVQPNDEVLIPALTFIATANAVTYCSAIPHFVDSEERTLGMDPSALRVYLTKISYLSDGLCINRKTNRVIRVLMPMHTFGHPVDLEGLLSVAQDFHLTLVEDAAESLGSTYYGKHTGTFGQLGALSFNGNKLITTGGGGAILTDNPTLARRAKHITTTAKVPHKWKYVHDEIGYNYRMPNLNAALGCAQLEKISSFLVAKRHLFNTYKKGFEKLSGLKIFSEPEGCRSNYWLQVLLLDESISDCKDAVLNSTNGVGLMTRPAWTLIPNLKPYRSCPKSELCISTSLESRLINLPSSVGLPIEQALNNSLEQK